MTPARPTRDNIAAELLGAPPVELFAKPTPLERLTTLTGQLERPSSRRGGPNEIWAKRDDLMSAGLGGNKLRNLEVYVADARRVAADTLVAAGRREANHSRLTAAAAARSGLRCILILAGPPPRRQGLNERLCERYGAQLRYTRDASESARDVMLAAVVDELDGEDRRAYVIEPGASGALGAQGQVLAGIELAGQLDDLGLSPDYVFVGVATGATYAGLKVGLWLSGLACVVVGVPTHLALADSEGQLRAHIAELARTLRDKWAGHASGTLAWSDDVLLDDLTPWRPFGVSTAEAADAAALLAATEAILADPTYSARSLSGLLAWARAGRLAGRIAVFWHAGGLPGAIEAIDEVDAPRPRRATGPG